MHTVRSLSALALVAAIASSPIVSTPVAAQRVNRGSELGSLLVWTPADGVGFTYAPDGRAISAVRYGSLGVLAHAGDWGSAYLTTQSALFGAAASERSLRFTREVFWVDLDHVGGLIDQFAAANQTISAGGGGYWTAAGERVRPSTGEDADWPRLFGRDPEDATRPTGVDVRPLTIDEPFFTPRDVPTTLSAADVTTVPEPSTYMLVAVGLMMIVVLARRRPARVRSRSRS